MSTETFWTLIYDNTEKSFEDWGLSQPKRRRNDQDQDAVTFEQPGAELDDDPIFDYDEIVKIWRGRTLDPVTKVYAGGTLWFIGRVLEPDETGDDSEEGKSYTIAGPWFDLEDICFQQHVNVPGNSPTDIHQFFSSELFLMQDIIGKKYTVGQQLREIIQYGIDQGAYLQMGDEFPALELTLDQARAVNTGTPTTNAPICQQKEINCGEAIRACLQWVPDAAVWFDYTTDPPTIHCKKQSAMQAMTLAIQNRTTHKGTRVKARRDLQVPCVAIRFKIHKELQGKTYNDYVDTVYPLNADGRARGVLPQTIELQGIKKNIISAPVQVEGMVRVGPDASGATDTPLVLQDKLIWWTKRDGTLNNPLAKVTRISNPSYMLENGLPLSSVGLYDVFPSILIDGSIPSWATNDQGAAIKKVRVKMTATVDYDLRATEAEDAPVYQRKRNQLISINATLTDAETKTYTALTDSEDGDDIPIGLAQDIYNSLSTLQFEGTHVVEEDECNVPISIGNVLNLSGGKAAWANMKAVVRSIDEDLESGTTTIQFGPARHLSAGDLTTLFLMNRYRRVWNNPLTRITGESTDSTTVTFSDTVARENTVGGMGHKELSTIIQSTADDFGLRTMVQHDANNGGQIIMQVVANDGSLAAGQSRVAMLLADLGGQEAKFRDMLVCLYDEGGNPISKATAKILMTDPIPL